MDTVGTIQDATASYLQRTAVADFITATGSNIFYLAINNARRWAERAHNFAYSETDVFLSIGSRGSPITAAFVDSSILAAGTLSPNIAGSFALTGTYNALPFYTRTAGGTVYFLAYSGTAWNITAGGFTVGADYWRRTTASDNPTGQYTPAGTYTGTLTISQLSDVVSIKTIKNVMLPISDGYYSVEFLTNDEWNERVQRQIGREHYNPVKTLEQVGVYTTNPVSFQQGQTVFLTPSESFIYPVAAKLSVVRWLPDYVATTDTDFLIQRAPDFMLFQTLIEINKYFRTFSPRQEGNIDEEALSAERDAAFSALLAWDASITGGTTTPTAIQPAS